jgi:hypothetical protein
MAGGHSGRRSGAGRPPGSGWRPAVTELRTVAVERRTAIAASIQPSTRPTPLITRVLAS